MSTTNAATKRGTRLEHPASGRRRLRAGVVALGLCLSGCGGGGGGQPSTTAAEVLVTAPAQPTTVLAGSEVRVRVTGVSPGAVVTWAVDADGDLQTTDDRDVIPGSQTADAAGIADGIVWTGSTLPGTYVLLAVTPQQPAGVPAPGPLTIATASLLTGVFGGAAEFFTAVSCRPDGGLVAVGMVQGVSQVATLSGVRAIDTEGRLDGLVTTWSGAGQLEDLWTIRGTAHTGVWGVAAGSGGAFVGVGTALGAAIALDGSVPGVAASWPASGAFELGFAAQYLGGALVGGAILGNVPPSDGAGSVNVTCIAPDGDDGWILGLTGAGVVSVGNALTVDLGAGGAAVVRMAQGMAPVSAAVVLSGWTSLAGIQVLASGDLLVAGAINGPVVLAPGRPSATIVGGIQSSAFVARLDPSGALLDHFVPSSIQSAGYGGVHPYAFDALPDGRCALVGRLSASVVFGPGVGREVPEDTVEGFVLALAPDLTPLWSDAWIPEGEEVNIGTWWAECTAVAMAQDGGIFVGGGTPYRIRLDDETVGSGVGLEWDAAIVRYESAGALAWTVAVVSDWDQFVNGLAVDPMGAVVAVGATKGPTWVKCGTDGTQTLLPFEGLTGDAFLLRIDPDGRQR